MFWFFSVFDLEIDEREWFLGFLRWLHNFWRVNSDLAANDWTVYLYCKSRAEPGKKLDENAPAARLNLDLD